MARRAAYNIALTETQWAEIEMHLRRRNLIPRVRERLEMVKAVGLGYAMGQIEVWSGRSAQTVRRWVRAYEQRGLIGLADAPRSGRPAGADAAYRQRLEQTIETPPRELGMPFDVWTSTRLSAYLAELTQVRITAGWLRHLLAQRRFVCGRPKHTLKHLQEPEDVARCERELADAEKKCRSSRSAMSSTTRMRRTWRPIPC
jgi:transposase